MRPEPRKPCRFAVGDKVLIVSTIMTRFAGSRGVIVNVKASRTAHTLDKYSVLVDGEEKDQVFWDIQLKAAVEDSASKKKGAGPKGD